MKTYKLGNKAKCIIRAYCVGLLGAEIMQHDNQPYTVLEDIEATVYFNDKDSKAMTSKNLLSFNASNVSRVVLQNVVLTEKVLNLLFKNYPNGLNNTTQYITSTDRKELYFPHNPIYEVFVYDNEGLVSREEMVETTQSEEAILRTDKANYEYLTFYSYIPQKSLSLNENNNNVYITLDLELEGNEDDQTRNAWIHLERCGLEADRTLFFKQSINTVDLSFIVLDGENYITFE